MLAQQLLNALSIGSVYALFALGFTLVFGVLGVVNLAHGAVFMVGAYAARQVVVHGEAPLVVGILVAFVLCALLGLVIDYLVLRPLRKRSAPHLIPMIATIGVAIIVNNAVQGFFGAENVRFPVSAVSDAAIEVAGLHLTVVELTIILLSLSLMALLLFLLRKTQMGRAMRAVAESPKASRLLGIDTEAVFLLTSAIAAGLGGVAGVLIAVYSNAMFPLMGQPMLHKGIAVIILGGLGDVRGALFGGLFLGLAEVLAVTYIGSSMRDAVAFGLLFLVLILRPKGLFGKTNERKV